MSDELDVNDILMTCALRFDGWAYQEATGFGHEAAIDGYFATGEWHLSPLEQMATFFILQRGLGKWGLEREPETSRYYRAWHELFFLACRHDAPERFQIAEYNDRWERGYKPRLAECVEAVRRLHECTAYEDNAEPLA